MMRSGRMLRALLCTVTVLVRVWEALWLTTGKRQVEGRMSTLIL